MTTPISTKNTVLAVVPEVTEGTPVAPTSASQYCVVQGDLAFKPDFNVLKNAEVVASIGQRQSILGAEKPSASFSHYLKHGGTEGTAPEWSNVLKGAFGTQTTISSEEQTVSSSTVSDIKVTSGHGVNFSRGQGLLVKDPVNGYSIRAVDSIATDDLTPSFNLPGAPGSGVKLGKPVIFSPAQTGHISMTLWRYLNQGAAVEMIAGARCTDINIKATAGELINAQLQFQGIQYYKDPLVTTSSAKSIDWTDDGGTFAASVAAQTWKDPEALAAAIQTAMQATATTASPTCSYSETTGKFTFKATGTLLTLKWNTGTNTATSIAAVVGFSTAADSSGTGATTGYSSATALSLASPQTPTLDSTAPVAAKSHEIMIGAGTDTTSFSCEEFTVQLTNTRTETKDVSSASGVSGSVFTGRMVKGTIKGYLQKYDNSKFDRFINNSSTRIQYSFGNKSGGNWVPGQCGCIYLPTTSITKWDVANASDLAILEIEFTAFVDSTGSGECYLSFL